YFGGFIGLVRDGADFQKVDKVMERFGWPMGPAYLLDVVGMDTAKHAGDVMAEGFPDRMKHEGTTAIDIMFEAKRLGQKSNEGFYKYETDKKGKPKKISDAAVYEMLKPVVSGNGEFDDQTIIERMMIPLCIETVRCLEDGIVETPAEADMGLIFGIGFPRFRGGALRYIDSIGLDEYGKPAEQSDHLVHQYRPTDGMQGMAGFGKRFYS